nr:hypothetical protein [uncultured Flavobacterium sp.]
MQWAVRQVVTTGAVTGFMAALDAERYLVAKDSTFEALHLL